MVEMEVLSGFQKCNAPDYTAGSNVDVLKTVGPRIGVIYDI